jgi:hypothetical protein
VCEGGGVLSRKYQTNGIYGLMKKKSYKKKQWRPPSKKKKKGKNLIKETFP